MPFKENGRPKAIALLEFPGALSSSKSFSNELRCWHTERWIESPPRQDWPNHRRASRLEKTGTRYWRGALMVWLLKPRYNVW